MHCSLLTFLLFYAADAFELYYRQYTISASLHNHYLCTVIVVVTALLINLFTAYLWHGLLSQIAGPLNKLDKPRSCRGFGAGGGLLAGLKMGEDYWRD